MNIEKNTLMTFFNEESANSNLKTAETAVAPHKDIIQILKLSILFSHHYYYTRRNNENKGYEEHYNIKK